jgi:hypothetical protein
MLLIEEHPELMMTATIPIITMVRKAIFCDFIFGK